MKLSEAVQMMLIDVKARRLSPRTADFYEFQLMRVSKLLNDKHVRKITATDLNGAQLLIHGKGNKQRVVPIPSKLLLLLLRYKFVRIHSVNWDEKGTTFFRSRKGSPLTTEALAQIIVRIGKKANIKLHTHLLRHTWATVYMSHDGADVLSLKALGGWSQISMAGLAPRFRPLLIVA